MVASPTVYLISGANRGIGLELVTQLSARPGNVIFAGARDPSKADKLNARAQEKGNIEVVKLAAPDAEDAQAVAKVIEQKAGKLDVLIANVGISDHWVPLVDHKVEWFREMFEVNTLGPLVLFQQSYPLLAKSAMPKFFVISSELASTATATSWPMTSYGTSKCAINHILNHAHHDYPDLLAVSICPGWVATDIGNAGARLQGKESAPTTVEDSVTAILKLADNVTRKTHGGKC
ncbi:hypothetical protein JCM8097_003203 [Rhodosporidiobolus ruineniae]